MPKLLMVFYLRIIGCLCFSFITASVVFAQHIIRVEYFVDTDPGFGKATPVPVTPAPELTDLSFSVDTDTLLPGIHQLFVRALDANGVWSLTTAKSFIKETLPVQLPNIVKAEYFIDTDPGFGNATSIDIPDTTDVSFDVDLAGVAAGFHQFSVRVLDSQGRWSVVTNRSFYIPAEGELGGELTQLEYYIDTDPGIGKGTIVKIPQASGKDDLTEINFDVGLREVPEGNHFIYARAMNGKGAWGPRWRQEFTRTKPALTGLSPGSGGNTGNVTLTITGEVLNAGTQVKLTRAGFPDIVVPDTMIATQDGKSLQATLDLQGKAIGDYNVVVTIPNDTVMALANAFKVEPSTGVELWAEMMGSNFIRWDTWQNYTVVYGNRGNVDAYAVPLWIVLPYEVDFELQFSFARPADSALAMYDWSLVPDHMVADSLPGFPFKAKVISVIVPIIMANETNSLNILVRVPPAVSDVVKLGVWVSKPKLENGIDIKGGRLSQMSGTMISDAWIDCLADILLTVTGIFAPPPIACAVYWNDFLFRPFIYGLIGDKGRKGNSYFDKNGNTKYMNIQSKLMEVLLACFAPPLGTANRVMRHITGYGFLGAYDLNASCREAFLPPDEYTPTVPVTPVASIDPNNKIGNKGAGPKQFLSDLKGSFRYMIQFENLPAATAPAQTVLIIDTLDVTKFDLSSFELGFAGFDKTLINVPIGRKKYTKEMDLRPEKDMIVRLEATFDEQTGVAKWLFTSIDPSTMRLTDDPLAGFLPPNTASPEGSGEVFFTIRLADGLTTNTVIENRAWIYFDNNQPIITPTWSNSLDVSLPESKVAALAPIQSDTTFAVSWNGSDEGSGIAGYDVWVSTNNSPYWLWQTNTPVKSANFTGKVDSTYSFYTVAIDSTGNKEMVPTTFDATTRVANPTGIEESLASKIKVYPNPADELITIEMPIGLILHEIQVLSITGSKMIKNTKLFASNQQHVDINTSLLSAGLYLLQIKTNKRMVYRKIGIK